MKKEKEIEDKIVKLLEDARDRNNHSEFIYNGIDIAISIIKDYQEEKYFEQRDGTSD